MKTIKNETCSQSQSQSVTNNQIITGQNEQTPNRTNSQKIWTFLIERNTVGSAWGTHTQAYKLYLNKLNNTHKEG